MSSEPHSLDRDSGPGPAIEDRYRGLPLPERVDALSRKICRRQRILDGWETDFNPGCGAKPGALEEQRLRITAEQEALRNQLAECQAALAALSRR